MATNLLVRAVGVLGYKQEVPGLLSRTTSAGAAAVCCGRFLDPQILTCDACGSLNLGGKRLLNFIKDVVHDLRLRKDDGSLGRRGGAFRSQMGNAMQNFGCRCRENSPRHFTPARHARPSRRTELSRPRGAAIQLRSSPERREEFDDSTKSVNAIYHGTEHAFA